MGKLQPSGTPGRPVMSPPPKQPNKPADKPKPESYKACDQCGYSKFGGDPIARAKARVYVHRGTLYFCGHHLDRHMSHILERGYYFRELV